jgi:uncharacterized protein (TIGR02284 family)
VTNPAVRTLFGDLASRRAEFAAQLVPHAQRLGGTEASEGTTRGAMHRRWVAMKDVLLGHNEQSLIQDAELRKSHDRVRSLLMH